MLRTLSVCLLSWAAPASPPPAQPTQGRPASQPAEQGRDDFVPVLDRILAEQVAKQQVPGAALAIAKDGRLVFARGYGFADLERRTLVDSGRTLFYLGSITKSFTATAVMQLVETGRLDLRSDVNRYLRRFQVPATFAQPIALAHLLTHSAGFEDRTIGYVARSAGEARTLGDYLAHHLPARVRPPGEVTAYSNHGYGLAGHIVESVSGEGYAQYVRDHILRPLGMSRSVAEVPLPAELAADLAIGYQYDPRARRFEPQPLGFRNLPPAGSISATAEDMARYMIAHLQQGRYERARILRDTTAGEMQRRQFAHHPSLPGLAFGFYERQHGGARLLEHAGSYLGYSALLVLEPERNLGIFLAVNSSNSRLNFQVLEAFLKQPPHVAPQPAPRAASRGFGGAARVAGYYRFTRHSRTTVEKLATWDLEVGVSSTPEGTLLLEPRNRDATEWSEIEPLLFRRKDGAELLAFREAAGGEITHLFMSPTPAAFPSAFERVPTLESVRVQVPFVLAQAGVFASTFTLWPLLAGGLALGRKWRGAARPPGPDLRAEPSTAVLAGLLAVGFLVGMDAMLGNSSYRTQLVYGMTPGMIGLLCLPIAFAALVPLLLWFALRLWRLGLWSPAARLYYSLVAIASVLQVIFYLQWNLLGFRY